METDTFECGFCLSVIEADDYPKICPHCEIRQCQKCGSSIKGKRPELCYGCGAIMPEMEANFHRTGNFSCVYMETGWMVRNRGISSDGFYTVVSSAESRRLMRAKEWPYKDLELVRELSPEEERILGYVPKETK